MSRSTEAERGINTLYNYKADVINAVLNNRGSMDIYNHSQDIIEKLLKARLVRAINDPNTVQVAAPVARLVSHVTRDYRRRLSSGTISDLMNNISDSQSQYISALQAGSLKDMERFQQDITESVMDTCDTLHEVSLHFLHHIQEEFIAIDNLELRITENQRCIDRAEKINKLLDTLMTNDLAELAWHGNDNFLHDIFMQVLKKSVAETNYELTESIMRLRANLARLERDKEAKELSKLVDTLYAHYENNPGYIPDLDSMFETPACLNVAGPLEIKTYPNIVHESHLESLIPAVQNLRNIEEMLLVEVELKEIEIPDKQTAKVELSALDKHIQDIFKELPDIVADSPISGSELYEIFISNDPEADCDYDDWISTLIDRFDSLDKYNKCLVKVGKTGYIDTRLDGNHYISDVTFEHA